MLHGPQLEKEAHGYLSRPAESRQLDSNGE